VRDAEAFQHAAAAIRAAHITSDADLEPLLENPPAGIDPEALRRLRHMFDAGGWVLLESAIADLPLDLRWLFESGALDIEQLGRLHGALGATTAGDLASAVALGQVRAVEGLSPAIEDAIAAALPSLRSSIRRVPLGRATVLAEPILAAVRAVPGVDWAEAAGSLRRGDDLIGDIELLAATATPQNVIDTLVGRPEIARQLHRSSDKLYVLIDRVQVGVRCVAPDRAGAAMVTFTGNAAHLAGLRGLARARGLELRPEGVMRGAECIAGARERDVYTVLGLAYVPPEIREGGAELDAARSGNVPVLVAREHIRGDLHMHSSWSDGRDTIEAMVKAAADIGYEYIAITDHSPHSAAARNLSADGVSEQADEIAALRERYPQIEILHGCEVDILPNGVLDFPDRILERFDIVLASLHDGAGHPPERLLERYEAAMRHPLVTVITHPTNRLVPYRAPYNLDYDRLFELAVETATALEIDGAPGHLDLNGALARRAVAAGATIAVDSDSHRAEWLERQMRLGITMARRGWVEPRHVLNTQPLSAIRARIAAKRGHHAR
jgi:DNA polymerase (family 10)